MKSRRALTVTGVLSCLALAGYFYWTSQQAPTPQAQPQAAVEAAKPAVSVAAISAPTKPKPGADSLATDDHQTEAKIPWNGADYAKVLAGTEIDGHLKADANGNLIVDLGVKDFFDYFFSAVGEVTPEQAIEEIRKQANLRLPESAAKQAMRLLADYITYQHSLQGFMQQPLVPANQQNYAYYAQTLRDSFNQIKALRRQIFTPEAAQAFFGLDETYADYTVATMQVRADSSLSDSEKEARIEELKQQLPEQMRTADAEGKARATVIQKAHDLYASGQDESSVREVLKQQFDDQTVDTMLQQYKRDAEWNKRLDQYMAERKTIQDSGLSEMDKQAQIDQLRQSMFAQDEIVRVESNEAIQTENARYTNQNSKTSG